MTHQTRILTPDQRPRVFVSSTLQELAAERAAARSAVEAMRLIPVMFELGARPHPARALYRAYLAQSHVFVGLYFERYGWVAPGEDASGLEDEYRLSGSLPRLVYLKSPAPGREPALKALVDRIRDDDTVAYKSFSDADELRRLLSDDLAVLLSERYLFHGDDAALASPPAGDVLRATPVPRPLSSLVGRDTEIAAVEDLLRSGARLVTVVGPGGIGKTRVALEAASRVAARDPDEVSFVALEAVDDPGAVLPAIAASIGLGLDGGIWPPDALAAAFADRPFLLVLDNVEQVQDAVRDVGELLARCPNVSVLATSRAPLKVRGEQLVPVGPLELGDDVGRSSVAQSPAVRLFVERARAARPAFSIDDPADADAVVELCRRLDGIPLALELAAARSAVLAPRALLDRIGTALDLGAGATDLPPRQRTLRATLAWSRQLLSPAQAALLARVSVFAAPWTLADAEAVADPASADVLDDVAGLVENSLVAPAADARGEPRFRLYETVRAYAAEQLDEAARDQVESAYVARLTRQAGELAVRIRSRDRDRWMAEFRTVWPDIRRAWELALRRGDAEAACHASISLVSLWLDGRVREAVDLVDPSLALADEVRPPHHGELVFACGQAVFNLGDHERGGALIRRLGRDVSQPDDLVMVAAAPMLLAFIASDTGDMDACERGLQRSLDLLRGAPVRAQWLEAYVHNGLAEVLVQREAIDEAAKEFALAQTLGRSSGNVGAEMQALVFEAALHLKSGERDRAHDLLARACPLVEVQPFYEGSAYCLEVAAGYAATGGNAIDGARLLGMAEALRDALGARMWTITGPLTAQAHDAVHNALDEASFEPAYAEGRALDPRSGGAQCRAVLGLEA